MHRVLACRNLKKSIQIQILNPSLANSRGNMSHSLKFHGRNRFDESLEVDCIRSTFATFHVFR